MRNELEILEKIEQYLRNELSPAEEAAFEQQIADDPQLQEEVRLQQELMQGIERAGWKVKVQQAGTRFRLRKNITKWGFMGLGAVLLTAAILYYVNKNNSGRNAYDGKALPAYNEAGEQQWASADSNITAQLFTIDAGKDTVVETKGGITLAIPANGFVDKAGKPVTGKVELVVKEALDAATIIQAGLSSTSGNQLLESGGMFYIGASVNGQPVQINPAAGIHVDVPADRVKPGMQLYKGECQANGRIDWVNPQPLNHDLLPVDILSLDFYPPHYLDSLGQWGYDRHNKLFTDSLYYAFAGGGRTESPERAVQQEISKEREDFRRTDTTVPVYSHPNFLTCAIDPARIKTIWSQDFQNTLLATREFEQRMPMIHQAGDNELLEFYIKNLDKPLSAIDSMAASRVQGKKLKTQLLAFAARKDGKVNISTAVLRKLQDYYRVKADAYRKAITKTQQEFWQKQAVLDRLANRKTIEYINDSINRVQQLFIKELNLNEKEAWRQLGYDTSKVPRFVYTAYRMKVNMTGWYNVDKEVFESVRTRTTLDFTDSTGKKAVIQYLPVSFRLDQPDQYDRQYVYLLPAELNSFMRLDGANGIYVEKLNELISYTLVCVAWKKEQAFLYTAEKVIPGEHVGIKLAAVDDDELGRALNRAGNQRPGQEIRKELEYFHFEYIDQERRAHNQWLQELTWKVRRAFFPCSLDASISK